MSKIEYTMRTANGIQRLEVEASEEAHEQLSAVLRGLYELRDVKAELQGLAQQIANAEDWLDAAIDKTSLKPLFDKELL